MLNIERSSSKWKSLLKCRINVANDIGLTVYIMKYVMIFLGTTRYQKRTLHLSGRCTAIAAFSSTSVVNILSLTLLMSISFITA